MKCALLLISVLAIACGGKSEPAKQPTGEHGGGDEHANMPVEIKQFHDVLAPRYHADKGPQRMKDTCAAIPDFTAAATAIAKAVPPAGVDSSVWTDSTGKLAAAIADLDATCKANDAAKFDPAFEAMHASFHGVMEAAGGKPEHGEHEDHEGHEGHEGHGGY